MLSKYNLSNDLLSSLKEYVDYKVLKEASFYKNCSLETTYLITDKGFPSFSIYASPYKSWVHMGGTSATFPAVINVNGSNVSTGFNGLKIDYLRGRTLFNTGYTATVKASFAIKGLNSYISSASDQEICERYILNTSPIFDAAEAAKPNTYNVPCVFMKIVKRDDYKYELGGRRQNKFTIRFLHLSNNEYNLCSINDVFAGINQTTFTLLGAASVPFNEYGSLKNLSYNYETLAVSLPNNKIAFIERVDAHAVNSVFLHRYNEGVQGSIIDMQISIYN